MNARPNVETVMLEAGYVVLEGGLVLPILDYLDDDGEDCEPDDAVTCVAGNAEYGWITVMVFAEPVTVH